MLRRRKVLGDQRGDDHDNYVHDNENVGVWADTDNRGFEISGNYISNNSAEGLMYEISYNGLISDNTFVHNGVGDGPSRDPGFPTMPSTSANRGRTRLSPGHTARSSRSPGTPLPTTKGWGLCCGRTPIGSAEQTAPSTRRTSALWSPPDATIKTCLRPAIDINPLFTDCIWRTMNVSVTHNKFTFSRGGVGNGCSASNTCGYNALFSIYGSTAPYKGWIVPTDISENRTTTSGTIFTSGHGRSWLPIRAWWSALRSGPRVSWTSPTDLTSSSTLKMPGAASPIDLKAQVHLKAQGGGLEIQASATSGVASRAQW